MATRVTSPAAGVEAQPPPVEDMEDYEPSFGEAAEEREEPAELNDVQAEAAKLIQDATKALQNYIEEADKPEDKQGKDSDSDGSEVDDRGRPILRRGMGIRGYGQPMKFRGREYVDGCDVAYAAQEGGLQSGETWNHQA